jgi:hypothetical protein
MKIEVNEHDIEQGRRRDLKCCAIGRALDRAGVVHFGVTGPAVLLANELRLSTARLLPPFVQRWILDFDAGKLVEPFSFELKTFESVLV